MSELDDDIARGCLKNGEPIEARWGSGWWSQQPEQEQQPTDMDIWNDLQQQIDQLRSENEKLKEALRYIVDRGYTGASYVAKQALNEVTK